MKEILDLEPAIRFLDGLHRVTSLLNFANDESNLKSLIESGQKVSINIFQKTQSDHSTTSNSCENYVKLLEMKSLNLTRFKTKTVGHTILDVFLAIDPPKHCFFEHEECVEKYIGKNKNRNKKLKLNDEEKSDNITNVKRTILYTKDSKKTELIEKCFGPELFKIHQEFLKNETYFHYVKKSSGLKDDDIERARETYKTNIRESWSLEGSKKICQKM